jgi:F0F1-type ATP synthase assembly protein I
MDGKAMTEGNQPPNLGRYASIGVEFTVTFLVPLAVGYWIDGKAGTRPGFMLLGGAIGFAAALWRLIRQGRQIDREQRRGGDDGHPQ